MTEQDKLALRAYSKGSMSAIELRRRLGGATYGDVLLLSGKENLPLPRGHRRPRRTDRPRAPRMFPKDES